MRFLLIILALFFINACITDEGGCVNFTDCPEGYICEDGACIPPESLDDTVSQNDDSVTDNVTASDDATVNDENAVDQNDDNDIFSQDDDNISQDETPDETPDESAECPPGWHFEEEGDDENDDGKYTCVQNVACSSEPCNGGQCTDKGMTATCVCLTGYAGRWCADCDEGYLKSTVDGKCKPDCENHDYECTGAEECGVDPTTNEAGCVCAQHYFGTDCTMCDGIHFCNSHGTCSAPSGAPICSCTDNWTGNDCSQCSIADGYIIQEGNCIKNCNSTCGQFLPPSYGDCQFTGTKMECVCDSGWKNPFLISFITPECSECDTANPPSGGRPEEW